MWVDSEGGALLLFLNHEKHDNQIGDILIGAHQDSKTGKTVSRRGFLMAGAGAAASLISASAALGAVIPRHASEKRLCFHNAHTGERLSVCYCKDGHYLPEALLQINYILRDFRTGEVKAIDTDLLDTLHHLSRRVSRRCTFHIISGYRSPATNALLRKKSRGVAKNSYHMYGKAIDIFVPGCRLSRLRQLALKLRAGGVGYYPKTGFIHLDVGPVRRW